MPPSEHDSPPLQQWLTHQPASLRAVLTRAQQLAEMNRSLREWANEPWITHVQLANFRDDTLVFYSSSAAALSILRHRQAALLQFFRQRFQLSCTRIETKVRPDA